MTQSIRSMHKALVTVVATLFLGASSGGAVAATAEDLDKDAAQALQALYKSRPAA